MQDQVIKLVLDLKKELPTATSKDIAQTLAPDLNITDDQEIDDLATQIDGLNEEVLKKKEDSDPIQGLMDQPIGLGSGPTKSASLKPRTSFPSLQERVSILNPMATGDYDAGNYFFRNNGGFINKTPGVFSHEKNPIDIVAKGNKIGEMTGGEYILNPSQAAKMQSLAGSQKKEALQRYVKTLFNKFNSK